MKDINVLINNGINVNGSLELLGDMDMYNETLGDFLNEVDSKLANIKMYKEMGDMENYAILVHSLKSDSKYLGFVKLAELSYNHEMESKANNSSYVNEHYNELMSEAARILSVVKLYNNVEETSNVVTNLETDDKKKILVVDDSNIIRNLIQKMFDNDYKVLTAEDGSQAIEIINTEYDDLVGMLLDLNMPNVNGFQVLEHLKDNNLFAKIPVSIITGDDSRETVLKAFDYPIVDVLAKPFNENDVKRVITAMLNFK
ncbi:MAG: response regulator [Bacilli bacterium]|nr:response regulator [Bacilli bacterium]